MEDAKARNFEDSKAELFTFEEPIAGLDGYDENINSVSTKTKSGVKPVVGIPAYNEEKTIASIVLKAKRYVDEVIVVDDGSSDDTVELAEEAGAKVIELKENKGKGEAMKTLFQYARQKDAEVLVTLDGDGQHPVHQVPELLSKVLDGEADIVIGSRFIDDNHKKKVPAYRRFGNRVLSVLTPSGKTKNNNKRGVASVKDTQSGFRAYSQDAIEKITPRERSIGVDSEILMQGRRNGLEVLEIPASVSYDGKTSHEGPFRHTLKVIGSIIRYIETNHSLLFFGLPGLIAFLLGIFMGLRTIILYNNGGTWPLGYVMLTGLLLIGGMAAGITGLILHAIINAHRRDYR